MWKFSKMSYKQHILIAFVIRFLLIIYSEYHDQYAEVPYTDIDYRVFTDAARYIWNNKSPYERHTYRYTPLIAILLVPNIILHPCFGKVVFSLVDLLVGYLIRLIVVYSRRKFKSHCTRKKKMEGAVLSVEDRGKKSVHGMKCEQDEIVADFCMLFWIYNPLTVIISTRGNSDSIAGCLVLLTIYFLECKQKYFTAGLIHGLAIHLRLYPIIYSLTYFMYLSEFAQYSTDKRVNNIASQKLVTTRNMVAKTGTDVARVGQRGVKKRRTIFKKDYLLYLIPNFNQLELISGCVLSLTSTILLFYYLYGHQFLFETYVYHFIRKDIRHNFSLFFYIQYLTAGIKNIGIWQRVLCVLPPLVLLMVFSVRHGLNKFTLHFSLLAQTIVVVAYNSVLTSQYFVWILAVLPLTLWQFDMTVRGALVLVFIWFAAQVAWLLPAYFLEFHGQNTFLFIWVQSLSLFCANMAVLGRLIKCFMYKNK